MRTLAFVYIWIITIMMLGASISVTVAGIDIYLSTGNVFAIPVIAFFGLLTLGYKKVHDIVCTEFNPEI